MTSSSGREQECVREAFALIDELQALTTAEAISRRLSDAFAGFGFHAFLMTRLPLRTERIDPYIVIMSWPREWLARYGRKSYYAHDPRGNLKVSARSLGMGVWLGAAGERPRRNRIERNRGQRVRRLWGSMPVPAAKSLLGRPCGTRAWHRWCGSNGGIRGYGSGWRRRARHFEYGTSMRCCDRLATDDARRCCRHEVSNLGDRRRRGPGRTSTMVMVPPQHGHGAWLSL